ncbi:MAG: putative sugar nucleotidyl transferase [Bacteroidetes bacterium]|nr:putative sugar nucleotidyl transferase [Bacteroidota bacterium]
MNVILFDDTTRDNLLPLTYTKPLSHLRLGALKIIEKWEKRLDVSCSVYCAEYLMEKYGTKVSGEYIAINSSVLPDLQLVEKIKKLSLGQGFKQGDKIIAYKSKETIGDIAKINFSEIKVTSINHLWDLFLLNPSEILKDVDLVGQKLRVISQKWEGNFVIGDGEIYVGENVHAQGVSFNTSEGPIVIGNNVTIMEGALLRGPLAIGDGAVIKMGAKIYGGSTIGPKCTVGGEIKNAVFQGFSNKGHDGYIGNSVIGVWCNMGADTNCSNMKNTLGEIKVWSIAQNKAVNSGQTFCGIFMADYVRTAIGTRLNTGSILGVAANVFENAPVVNYMPSFSWGEHDKAKLDKIHLSNGRLAKLKNEEYSEADQKILNHLYEILL